MTKCRYLMMKLGDRKVRSVGDGSTVQHIFCYHVMVDTSGYLHRSGRYKRGFMENESGTSTLVLEAVVLRIRCEGVRGWAGFCLLVSSCYLDTHERLGLQAIDLSGNPQKYVDLRTILRLRRWPLLMDETDLNLNLNLNLHRCPLLMDVTDRSATFLKYRDTNYINALDPVQMQPATVRIALLGALRYGKPIVFDMMELDR